MLQRPLLVQGLIDLGLDVEALLDMSDYIFSDPVSGEDLVFSLEEFMELVFQLRGSNVATFKDVMDLKRYFLAAFKSLDKLRASLAVISRDSSRMGKSVQSGPKRQTKASKSRMIWL